MTAEPDPLELLLTASRAELVDRDSAIARAFDADPALRAGAELVVAAESAMAAEWTAPRASIDVGVLITRRRRRWLGRGNQLLFWGCAVPFAAFVLLATVFGLGALAYVTWFAG
ncbi:MAG: hypothetical protein V4617_01750 [Gemmatimonadota bacterium]